MNFQDDFVQIRATLDEEVLILLKHHVLTFDPLLELERSGTNRFAIHRMGFGILAVTVHVLGDNRHQQRR